MSPRTQVRGRDAIVLAALVASLLAWGALYILRTSVELPDGERVFTLWDDAMISMQYARNLQRGHGLVWNPGEPPVQGFTNPGVTLLMAGAHWLPLPPPRTALAIQGLALGMLVATGLLLFRLARQLAPESRAVAPAAALGTALCAPVAIWGLQGSDVGFVALWLAAAAVLATRQPLRSGWLLALLALGPWIRPDVALYVPLFLIAAARAGTGGRRIALTGTLLLVLSLGAWAGFSWLYYGDPLPNTWYLKATGSPRRLVLASGLGELLSWLPNLAVPLLLAGVALAARWRDPRVALLAALVAASQAYNLWVGGDFVFGYGSRFAVPTLPFLVLLALLGVDRLAARVASDARGFALVLSGALLALCVSPLESTREWLDPRQPTLLHEQNADNLRFARYLTRHTDPTTSLGAYWAGVPPYFSERPAIDVLGKSDAHIAKLDVPRFIPGHSKWDWDYVLNERRPELLRAPSRGLGKRDDFRRNYLKVETRDPGLSFFIRRSALAKLHDPGAILIDPTSGQRYRMAEPGTQPD
jgi:arabinofuranosyltransferase